MDLRTPSGWFFALLGLILVTVAILPPEERAPLTETNANLYSGVFMILFGAMLLWLAKRASPRG